MIERASRCSGIQHPDRDPTVVGEAVNLARITSRTNCKARLAEGSRPSRKLPRTPLVTEIRDGEAGRRTEHWTAEASSADRRTLHLALRLRDRLPRVPRSLPDTRPA